MFYVAIRLGKGNYVPNQPLDIDEKAFDVLRKDAGELGLGVKTGLDVPTEALGYRGPVTSRMAGNLLDFAIGQYDTYTPIQMAQYVSTIANGGKRIQPHFFVESFEENDEGQKISLLQHQIQILDDVSSYSLGLERVSMFKSLNKHWILGDNAESDDQWNDIGGIDLRYRFPGVQLYGSLYGEDQAGGFPSGHARSVGVYFPQLFGGDGCWDMRLELSDTNNWWYGHWYLVNGWTYKDDILGDAMGKNTRKYYGSISHYLANGDRIGLEYTSMDMDRAAASNPRVHEVQLTYAKKLNKSLYMDSVLGYAKIKNADYTSGRSDSSKLVAVGLRWEY